MSKYVLGGVKTVVRGPRYVAFVLMSEAEEVCVAADGPGPFGWGPDCAVVKAAILL
jgi:hypothetical protein